MLKGAFLIEMEKHQDSRGFFARTYCRREFDEHGLNANIAQCSVSFNKRKGTLRGMHYQVPPHAEDKVVRCSRGSIYDVMIDLRPESPTFLQHVGEVLSGDNGKMFFIPAGFAHGFQTLEDNTEVCYQMSEFYAPGSARGFRWDDPAFKIKWPPAERVILQRDQEYPLFTSGRFK